MSSATLAASLAAYQRDLGRASLPIGAAFCVAMAALAYAALTIEEFIPWPYRTAAKIVVISAALVFVQISVALFRRAVRRLSDAHRLVCASCKAVLGFHYATLKRTGKCGACGAPFPGAA